MLIQDDVTVRFRDRGHRRMGQIAAKDAPEFAERDLFKIPADSGFDIKISRAIRFQLGLSLFLGLSYLPENSILNLQ